MRVSRRRGASRCLPLLRLDALPVRCLFRPVAADRHAAPTPRVASRVVGEEQRAGGSLAGLHVRKVFSADEPRKSLGHRQQQRVGRAPSRHGLKLERTRRIWVRDDPEKAVAVLEQAVERRELREHLWRQRATRGGGITGWLLAR